MNIKNLKFFTKKNVSKLAWIFAILGLILFVLWGFCIDIYEPLIIVSFVVAAVFFIVNLYYFFFPPHRIDGKLDYKFYATRLGFLVLGVVLGILAPYALVPLSNFAKDVTDKSYCFFRGVSSIMTGLPLFMVGITYLLSIDLVDFIYSRKKV